MLELFIRAADLSTTMEAMELDGAARTGAVEEAGTAADEAENTVAGHMNLDRAEEIYQEEASIVAEASAILQTFEGPE
jgi:hypothetical protein